MAIYAAHARCAKMITGGFCSDLDFEATGQTIASFAFEQSSEGIPVLAACLSQALCYCNRMQKMHRGLLARILVLDGSNNESDFASQSTALANCAFAAQAKNRPIDCHD